MKLAGHPTRRALAAFLLCGASVAAAQPEVTLGAEDDAAPWSYADGTGYANDLVRAAFEAAGWKVRFEVLPYARCKLLAVRAQLPGCLSMSETAELERDLLYPKEPVFEARNVLFVNADSTLTGCTPAKWNRSPSIGFVNGYEYIPAVDILRQSNRLVVDESNSEVSNLRKLAAGRIDGAIITLDKVKRIDYLARLAQLPNTFKPICDFGGFPAYLAFSRRHPQGPVALAAFSRGMAALKKNGDLARLQSQWAAKALELAGPKIQ